MPSPRSQTVPDANSQQGDELFPTLGILGGGQLGKMMAQAALQMGLGARLLAPKDAGPMRGFAGAQIGDWRDPGVLQNFADGCDAVTVESEWAPAAEARDALPQQVDVWPSPHTLRLISHKGRQKAHLREAGLPVPDFRNCETLSGALDAADALGYPVVAKQYEGSYDGYGNATCEGEGDLRAAWDALSATSDTGGPDGLMIEQFAAFERELATLVARTPNGESAAYPVVHTEQRDHRCHAVLAPAPDLDKDLRQEAQRVAAAAAEAVEGVGITAVELFEMPDGALRVNELAPRPHNTGHYTIEACPASQFENHVRAVLGLPLGAASLRVPRAVMVNVLGERQGTPPRFEGVREALGVAGTSVHVYGKPEVRPTRKMGHVTVTGPSLAPLRQRAEEAAARIQL
jgi:5-(carboxyamino)imidazole ribonucleotide synthase